MPFSSRRQVWIRRAIFCKKERSSWRTWPSDRRQKRLLGPGDMRRRPAERTIRTDTANLWYMRAGELHLRIPKGSKAVVAAETRTIHGLSARTGFTQPNWEGAGQ